MPIVMPIVCDCNGYDPAIGQLVDYHWAITIGRQLSYGRSILNMFDKLTATDHPGTPVGLISFT